MAILSNVEIAEALNRGNLTIDPQPTGPPSEKDSYDTCSVHLRLGDRLWVPREGVQLAFDLDHPGSIQSTLTACFEEREIPQDGSWVLAPGMFIMGTTREWFASFQSCQRRARFPKRFSTRET